MGFQRILPTTLRFLSRVKHGRCQASPRVAKTFPRDLSRKKAQDRLPVRSSQTIKPKIQSKVGKQELEQLFYLDAAGDPQLFEPGALNFGRQLIYEDQLNSGLGVLGHLSQNPTTTPKIQEAAKVEFGAVMGQGDSNRRWEFLAGKLPQDALDHKMIIPMILGTGVYQLGRAFFLGRLAGVAKATWYTRGMGANVLAGLGAFSLEVPAFALSSRGLRQLHGEPVASIEKELLGAGIVLSFLKITGLIGRKGFQNLHGIGPAGAPVKLVGLSKDLSVPDSPGLHVCGADGCSRF